MDEELMSLKENDVWDVIPKPAGRKIVASRWESKQKEMLKEKSNNIKHG